MANILLKSRPISEWEPWLQTQITERLEPYNKDTYIYTLEAFQEAVLILKQVEKSLKSFPPH